MEEKENKTDKMNAFPYELTSIAGSKILLFKASRRERNSN